MERAVITGMGVVSPIGNTLEEFESNLFAGRHGIRPIEHFDRSDMSVHVSALVKDLDASEYFAPVELRRLDPYTVFGLIAAKQALAQSGIVGNVDPYRIGVNMTSGLGGVETMLGELDTLEQRGPRKVSPLLIPKWIPNMIAGLVSIEAGARGAAIAHNAACASSAMSIGEGLRAIRHGYADAVVCGGAEAISQKIVMSGFQNLRALSTAADPDRARIPFDRERSGFVLGEGGAAIVLERESHARARGATIYAAISGYGVTSDASHITAPSSDGEALDRALEDAMREAGGVERDEAVYVNAHGTGTGLNDQVEAASIRRMLGPSTLVSSTKSMTGHMLGAAGAVEVIASAFAVAARRVPVTAGTKEVDADIDVDVVRGESRAAEFSRALSTSLGFGGHNTCLVIDRVD